LQFPNGRWGDQSSPAFGEADALLVALPHKPQQAIDLWGTPTSLKDISALFARFCRGELKSLPWSDQPAAKETSRIAEQLAKVNELGFLTVRHSLTLSPLSATSSFADSPSPHSQINSQPRVDGAKSEDPAFGWGPINGYVYQKVC
jgi:methylenetetrahydrofolate reductase (NADPH)